MNTKFTIALLFCFLLAQTGLFAQVNGDYQTKSSGKWNKKQNWQVYQNGNWKNANDYPKNLTDNTIYIRSGHTINTIHPNATVKDLVVETGGKLYRKHSSSLRDLKVYGNILCDGIIGNGAQTDALNIQLAGDETCISGSGEFKVYSMYKVGPEPVTDLNIDMEVELYKTSGQALYNNTDNTILNISIHISGSLIMHAELVLDAGIPSGKATLFIESNESGTGTLAVPSVVGSDESNTTIQQYVSEDMWHYICSPVKNSNASVFYNLYLMEYNEPDGTWSYITDPNYILEDELTGYGTWASSSLTGATTLEFSGEIVSGTHEIELTNTSGANHNHKGYNFVGNPYSTSINWDYQGVSGWLKDNLDDAIYLWKGESAVYGSYIDGLSTNGISNIIPAHQGFFVHCNESTGMLAINPGVQNTNLQPFLKSTGSTKETILKFRVHGQETQDETIVRVAEFGTPMFDAQKDAYKMFGSSAVPQVFSILDDESCLSINTLPENGESTIVRIGFKTETTGVYSLDVDFLKGLENYELIILEDLVSQKKIRLVAGVEYNFAHDPSNPDHRFNLIFNNHVKFKSAPVQPDVSSEVFVYHDGQKIRIKQTDPEEVSIDVFNLMGQHLQSLRSNESITSVSVNGTGYVIIRIQTATGVHTSRIYNP